MRRLSISRSKAYALLEELPHLRIGGAIRIRESALGAFLKRCEVTI
jgi:excisionase family DNA binding protein